MSVPLWSPRRQSHLSPCPANCTGALVDSGHDKITVLTKWHSNQDFPVLYLCNLNNNLYPISQNFL